MHGPKKPLLLYDGRCNFCRLWAGRWRSLTGDAVDYESLEESSRRPPRVPKERLEASVWLLEPDGAWHAAAEAVFRTLSRAPGRGWLLWTYRRVPGFAAASEAWYRFVAGHRGVFSVLTRWLWGRDLEPESFCLSRWLFLRLLGVAYLAAFASLWRQLPGLVGKNGILPAAEYLRAAASALGPSRFWALPTLCWLDSSDRFLGILCGSGAVLSGLLICGVAPMPVLALLWASYLSLVVVGQDFLGFQWDNLLLEAGLIAVFLAPTRLWPGLSREDEPSPMANRLLKWLLFRLMFESGCVKLLSGDPTWRNLTALLYHYETQPLPTWVAWYAHQLPAWFQKASVAFMFAVELGSPWLLWLPRRPRLAAAAALLLLQSLIAVTGNYCYFNLLAAALCLPLIDDSALLALVGPRWRDRVPRPGNRRRPAWRGWLLAPAAALAFAVGGAQLWATLAARSGLPGPLAAAWRATAPFRSINNYGLFAVMTTTRSEIIVEGTDDGAAWKEYVFKWKPGGPRARPRFVAPGQPRLDWQMWFAALGSCRENPWFVNFLARLLMGSAPVRALLAVDPFGERPPRAIRTTVYDYRFTDWAAGGADGTWWRRELKGPYCPVVSLEASHGPRGP